MKKQTVISNQDILYLEKLSGLPFMKEALFKIVYSKLFADGYVYCKDGLFPENKESLRRQLPAGSVLDILKNNKNPESFAAACERLSGIQLAAQGTGCLSRAECQGILYILLAPASKDTYADILLSVLRYMYPGSSDFSIKKSFIIRPDIELAEISSVEELVSSVTEIPETKNRFFRGHSNINYISVPSLFREPRLYKNEYIMYQELVVRCPGAFVHCASHLDFLVEMQHYGLPTRLLDITSNPLVALYFACENGEAPGEILLYEVSNDKIKYEKCDEAAILSSLPMLTFPKQKELLAVLKEKRLSSPVYEEFRHEVLSERPSFHDGIPFDKAVNPVFVKPTRRNQRIAHQEGAFIIWGLDENFYSGNPSIIKNSGPNIRDFRHASKGKRTVFYIPAARKEGIRKVLNQLGVNRAYVYPEIDDVAEYIKASIR